jgi:hypothetical protein
MFRKAFGINLTATTSTDASKLEHGHKTAVGYYRDVISSQESKKWQYRGLSFLIYVCHFSQILIGASLTALGPDSGAHSVAITTLAAVNTGVAGILALLKGQGLPERFKKDQDEYRKVQQWIEETDKQLELGIIGKDKRDVGQLIQLGLRKYNAAKALVEDDTLDNLQQAATTPSGPTHEGAGHESSGNA